MEIVKKKKQQFVLSMIVLGIVLSATIILFIVMKTQKIDFEEVECVVVDVTKEKSSITKKNYDTITVCYMDKEYEIGDRTDGYRFFKGSVIKAYFNGENVYLDENSLRSDNILGKIYMISLFATFVMLMFTLFTWESYKKQKQNKKSIGELKIAANKDVYNL